MRAGRLNSRFFLRAPNAAAPDGYEEMAQVPGELLCLGPGSEGLQGGTTVATSAYRLAIRYRTDVKADWQIVEKGTGRRFQIQSYGDPEGRRVELQMFCTEVQ